MGEWGVGGGVVGDDATSTSPKSGLYFLCL